VYARSVKVVLVLVLLVALAWGWARHGRIANEDALGAVATDLAGRPVGVRCQGFLAELVDIENRYGGVRFAAGRPEDHTFLTRETCARLKRFRTASEHPELDCLLTVDWSRWTVLTHFRSACSERARPAAEALSALTHEAMHLRGWIAESHAQCYAIQELPWTVERFGGTRAQGAAAASFVLALQAAMPVEYRSSECRAGGALDLHPETTEFPAEATPQLLPPQLYGPALQ